ncbi:unnamed protein product, partial [Rotaria sp. Silwood2]
MDQQSRLSITKELGISESDADVVHVHAGALLCNSSLNHSETSIPIQQPSTDLGVG